MRSANCKSNQTIYWDAKTPGLCLRVTASGHKSFVFESKLHGRTIRLTIGDIRTWTVGDAQREATDLKSLVDKCIDPRKQRAEQMAAADALHQDAGGRETTFGEAWNTDTTARKVEWNARQLSDDVGIAWPCTNPYQSIVTRGLEVVHPVEEALSIIYD